MKIQNLKLFYLFPILFWNTLMFGQNIDAFIKNLRQDYNQIVSNCENYRTKEIPLLENSTERGTAKAYFEGKTLKIIEAIYLGESGKMVNQYYYKETAVFLFVENIYTYNRPIYWDAKTAKDNGDNQYFDPEKSKIAKKFYYFKNGELLFCLDKNKEKIALTDLEISNKKKEIINRSAELQQQLQKEI